MHFKKLSLAIFSISLVSCSGQMIVSRDAPIKEVKNGVSYYLPKRLHKLTLTKTLAIKNKIDAEKKIAHKVNSQNEAKKAKIEFQKLFGIANLIPAGKGKESAIKSAHTAQGKYKYLESKGNKANISATHALEKLKGTETKDCKYNISLKIEQLPLVPDERFPYIAKLNHSYFRADDFKIETTTSGLLSNAFAEGEDKTGDIIVALAKTIAIAFGGVPVSPVGALAFVSEKQGIEKCDSTTKKIVGIVDLSKEDEVTNFISRFKNDAVLKNLTLSIAGYGVHINDELKLSEDKENKLCNLNNDKAPCSANDTKIKKLKNNEGFYSGLFYRRELPYIIKLQNNELLVDTALIFMPNASPISQVKFTAGMFVTSTYDVTFENGMLTSKTSNRPSEALGLVSIPLEVARGVMSVLTEFVQLKLNYTSENVSLATKEKELIEALQDLKEASEKQIPIPEDE